MIDASKTALILEGGGTRNAYTAPVVVKLIEEGVKFGWVGGVSAGAVHAVNFASGDVQRSKDNFTTFMSHKKIGGIRSLASGSGLLNAEFMFESSGDVLPFDWEGFQASDVPVHVEAVKAKTGETVAFTKEDMDTEEKMRKILRASSTLPMIMPMAYIDDEPYIDGALGASGGVLLQSARDAGFEKFFIVATRPRSYVRKPPNRPAMIKRMFPKYPGVAKAMIERTDLYNGVRQEIFALEESGDARVFWADDVNIENTEMKLARLQKTYDDGAAQLEREWDDIKAFLES